MLGTGADWIGKRTGGREEPTNSPLFFHDLARGPDLYNGSRKAGTFYDITTTSDVLYVCKQANAKADISHHISFENLQ